jgi:hypothetical protein
MTCPVHALSSRSCVASALVLPPLLASLVRRGRYRFIGVGSFVGLVFLKVLDAACNTMAPLINKQLILFLENSTDNYYNASEVSSRSTSPLTSWCGANQLCSNWQLVLLVFGLYISQLASGALRSYTEFQAKRMAMHSYAALTKVRVQAATNNWLRKELTGRLPCRSRHAEYRRAGPV